MSRTILNIDMTRNIIIYILLYLICNKMTTDNININVNNDSIIIISK